MAIPLVIAGIAAGAAAAGSASAGAAKSGANSYRASNFANSGLYDDNRFQYGGRANGAQEEGNRYRFWAENAQHRDAPWMNTAQVDQSRQLSMNARAGQEQAAGLMMRRATGEAPSIARMAADHQMNQAAAAQTSAAAGARGPGAIALAQQNAMGATGAAQAQIGNAAQVNEAQERMQAEQAAFGAQAGMRGQDMGLMGQEAQMMQQKAAFDLQQRGMNDQMSLGMSGLATGVDRAQLEAGTRQQQMLSTSHTEGDRINAQINQANADTSKGWVKGALGAIGSLSDMHSKNYDQPFSLQTDEGGGGGGGGGGMEKMMPLIQGMMGKGGSAAGASGGGAAAAGFMSDKQAKQDAKIEGLKLGLGLARGMSGPEEGDPDAPRMHYIPGQGWRSPPAKATPELDTAIAAQAETDRVDVANRNPQAVSSPLPSKAPHGYAASRAGQAGAMFDQNQLAPGTEDFEKTASKDGTPWWMTPVDTSAGFWSDDRTKLAAAFEAGKASAANGPRSILQRVADGATNAVNGDDKPVAKAAPAAAQEDEPSPPSNPIDKSKVGYAPARVGLRAHDIARKLRPSNSPVADANRTLEGAAYTYKPGFAPPEQEPGEKNFGPTAQNMEQSPVAATAVRDTPNGMKMIDRDKALKLALAGNAENQRQQDETRSILARLLGRK